MPNKLYIEYVRHILKTSFAWLYCSLDPKARSIYNSATFLLQGLLLLTCLHVSDDDETVNLDIKRALQECRDDDLYSELTSAIDSVTEFIARLTSTGVTTSDVHLLYSLLVAAFDCVGLYLTPKVTSNQFSMVGFYNNNQFDFIGINQEF